MTAPEDLPTPDELAQGDAALLRQAEQRIRLANVVHLLEELALAGAKALAEASLTALAGAGGGPLGALAAKQATKALERIARDA